MIDLTPIFQAVIALIVALITAFLIPYIKSKTTAERFADIEKWAKIAVNAAEMIYSGTGRGAEKKKYVIEFLTAKGYKLDIESIDNLIEAAVLSLQSEKPEEGSADNGN